MAVFAGGGKGRFRMWSTGRQDDGFASMNEMGLV
jgi:hypothetical protein